MLNIGTESHPSGHSQNDMKFSQTNGASSESQHGQKSAPLESSQTPNKYRRRPLTQEEIELVKVNKRRLIFFDI